MKKIIYIILLAFSIASVSISCTEEEIIPVCNNNGGGAGDTR
jgi:hypothetical protein